MNKLFLGGIELQKDLEFCAILEELRQAPDVLIISTPEPVEVVEMSSGDFYGRKETGITHTGYDLKWVYFALDNGNIFCVSSSSHYPFTDDNDPGKWNFIPYTIPAPSTTGAVWMPNNKIQMDYRNEYTLDAVRAYKMPARPISGVPIQDIYITGLTVRNVVNIILDKGGNRERAFLHMPTVAIKMETWNDKHKVIEILPVAAEPDGHRDSINIDIVTGYIVG